MEPVHRKRGNGKIRLTLECKTSPHLLYSSEANGSLTTGFGCHLVDTQATVKTCYGEATVVSGQVQPTYTIQNLGFIDVHRMHGLDRQWILVCLPRLTPPVEKYIF